MLGLEVVLGGVLLLAYLLYWRVSKGPGAGLARGSSCKLPPVEGGWVPWVGCAIAFGKEPLWFIRRAHEKVPAHCGLFCKKH